MAVLSKKTEAFYLLHLQKDDWKRILVIFSERASHINDATARRGFGCRNADQNRAELLPRGVVYGKALAREATENV